MTGISGVRDERRVGSPIRARQRLCKVRKMIRTAPCINTGHSNASPVGSPTTRRGRLDGACESLEQLVVSGGRDPAYPPDVTGEMVAGLPDAQHIEYPGAGHGRRAQFPEDACAFIVTRPSTLD